MEAGRKNLRQRGERMFWKPVDRRDPLMMALEVHNSRNPEDPGRKREIRNLLKMVGIFLAVLLAIVLFLSLVFL